MIYPGNWPVSAITGFLLVSAARRIWKLRSTTTNRHASDIPDASVQASTGCSVAPWFLETAGQCISAWVIFSGSTIVFPETGENLAAGAAAAIAAAAILELVFRFRYHPIPRSCAIAWISSVTALTISIGLAAGVLFLRSIPPGEPPIKLSAPVAGKWRVLDGGRTRFTNAHHDSPPEQNMALDMVLAEKNLPTKGQPVFAPASGAIQTADDGYSSGSGPAEGNLIIIKTSDNTEIWLAHLQKDSLTVIAGQTVTAGTPIARTGSSGSAAIPHLHIHAQRNGHAIPIVWKPGNRYLIRGDIFTFSHP